MKIGISGISGKLGTAVAKELQARSGGHEIVGISRNPNAGSTFEMRQGDYDKPETLSDAYRGLDRLLLIPSADLLPGVRARQLVDAIEAAIACGVQHIILLSAAGTRLVPEESLGHGPWVSEQTLMKRAPAWTILRMNYYSESLGDEIRMAFGSGALASLGEERVAFVSRDDIAAACAEVLRGNGHSGAIYNLTGPVAVTGPERAAIASEVTGQQFASVVITEEQLRAGLAQAKLPPPIVNVVVDIKKWFARGDFDVVTGDVANLTGHAPKGLREILKEYLK